MITIDKIEKATQKTPNYIEKQGNSGGDGRVFASFAAIAPAEHGDGVHGADSLPGGGTSCKILTNRDLGRVLVADSQGPLAELGQERPHEPLGG
jgi:hypothetical protein